MKGFVLGGTRSGVGKTVATLAAITALEDAGQTVQPAKAGPDFIDPGHHAAVAGRPSRTLDAWLQDPAALRRNYHRGNGDICVIEGVMGLYDGEVSSTAMVAEALDLPVVLVVDGSAGMESIAATAHGFRTFADYLGRDIEVAGIISQQTHGGRHAQGIRDALPEELTYFGRIPPDDRLKIPDRHLGLHSPAEDPIPEDALVDAAAEIETDRLLSLASEPVPVQSEEQFSPSDKPAVVIVRDEAFRFIYPATIECLRAGAEVATVSSIAGDGLPDADAIYIPGGYPELHAPALADSQTLDAIASAAAEGVPIYAECGGMMALAESLETVDGERYDMADVLPANVRMCERYQALDHVAIRSVRESPIARRDDTLHGHEFHYSVASIGDDARFAFTVDRGEGITDDRDGLLEYDTVGTYAHVHPASGAFDRLLQRAGGQ
ncbi:MAG: cobyrinic acid a,c-diamide synthase [Salinirussus sp.]